MSDSPVSNRPAEAPAEPNPHHLADDLNRPLVGQPANPIRIGLTGFLMGMANLVPGVSGGTMVLIMGLYENFIDAISNVTRGRFTWRTVRFLSFLIAGAVVAIIALSKLMTWAVAEHRGLMYSLFIGMTLAGTPVIWRMCKPPGGVIRWPQVATFLVGFCIMLAILLTEDTDAKDAAQALRESEAFRPTPAVVKDLAGGALAMSAMVLPGISGAYMLLVLGRYEHVTGAISMAVDVARGNGGSEELWTAFLIIFPVGVGAVLSMVLLANLLKWLLANYEPAMGGFLLGILWGSALAIWPFTGDSTAGEIGLGAGACVIGFGVVFALSMMAPKKKPAAAR